MRDWFKLYLMVTGIAAALALAFPPIVFIGFILFIVPGIFLLLAPLLFSYSLGWWLVRLPMLWVSGRMGFDARRWPARLGTGCLALAIVAAPGVVLPRILNAPAEDALARLQASDVDTAGPIELPDVVAIVLPGGAGTDDLCETLCQRLLYNHAVKRVVVDIEQRPGSRKINTPPRMFLIDRTYDCPNPPLSKREVTWPDDRSSRPLQRVAARIAAGECLQEVAGPAEQAGLTVAYRVVDDEWSILRQPWAWPVDTVEATRVEITNAGGDVVYRKTEVHAGLLATPLGVASGMSLLSTVRYFGWARHDVMSSEVDLNGRKVLSKLLGEAARPPALAALALTTDHAGR